MILLDSIAAKRSHLFGVTGLVTGRPNEERSRELIFTHAVELRKMAEIMERKPYLAYMGAKAHIMGMEIIGVQSHIFTEIRDKEYWNEANGLALKIIQECAQRIHPEDIETMEKSITVSQLMDAKWPEISRALSVNSVDFSMKEPEKNSTLESIGGAFALIGGIIGIFVGGCFGFFIGALLLGGPFALLAGLLQGDTSAYPENQAKVSAIEKVMPMLEMIGIPRAAVIADRTKSLARARELHSSAIEMIMHYSELTV